MARFNKGVSGNVLGRPKQAMTSTELRKRLAQDMPDILATLVDKAKAGDTTAIKIILDRTHPPLRPQALPVEVPIGANLAETGGNIISNTLQGQMAPDIGAMLISALANQAKVNEVAELTKQIQQLVRIYGDDKRHQK